MYSKTLIFPPFRNSLLLLQPTNLFLLNMSVADFLNLLFNAPLFLFKQGVIFR